MVTPEDSKLLTKVNKSYSLQPSFKLKFLNEVYGYKKQNEFINKLNKYS